MSLLATYPPGFDRDLPYNDLPPLPPQVEVESKRVLKVAIEAHIALADLRGAARLIPNQTILIRAIALQEARLSSEVEQIVTTGDELYRALSREDDQSDPQTKEVLRYGDAMWLGFGHLKKGGPLDYGLMGRLASTILKRDVPPRPGTGTRIGNPRTGKIIYTPPVGRSRIEGLLSNMTGYMDARDGTDPLVKVAITHYQFEAIHPFEDANGRVGRVLNILHLVQQGLLDVPILYLSRAILEDKKRYYNGLRLVTEEGRWEDWIVYMLESVAATAIETRRQIEAIRRELDVALELARVEMTRGYSKELIELVFEQPYTRIAFLERKGIAKRQAASDYLQELERIGLLQGERRGREIYYLNRPLLRVLSL